MEDKAESVTCASCGTVMSRDEVLRGVPRQGRTVPNLTPVKLGMKARLQGREYEVIGRVVMEGSEDGETFQWTEFQLLSTTGDVAYLEFDDGQWKYMEPFVPPTPFDPKEVGGVGATVRIDHATATVTDVGSGAVTAVEGELTYKATVGEPRSYLEAKTLTKLYGVEWTDDEIEFYRGRYLSEREVLQAFGLKEQLAALDRRKVESRSQNLFAALCMLLAIIAFIWGATGYGGGRVVQTGNRAVGEIGAEGARFGPFNLNPAERVHRLVVYGYMSESSAWVSGVLEQEAGNELIATQGDFWDESGRDSDGYWHESDLRRHHDFVARKTGPYYVRLYAESDNPGMAASQTAGFELHAGVLYPAPFFWYGALATILAVLFFFAGSREALKKMSEESS
jgi:hypothetical protein